MNDKAYKVTQDIMLEFGEYLDADKPSIDVLRGRIVDILFPHFESIDELKNKLRNLQRWDIGIDDYGYDGCSLSRDKYENGDYVEWEDIEKVLENK